MKSRTNRFTPTGSILAAASTLTIVVLLLVVNQYELSTATFQQGVHLGWSAVGAGSLVLIALVALTSLRQMRAVRHLAETDAQFRLIFQTSMTSILIHDCATGEIQDANQRAMESYGCSSLKELQQHTLFADPPYSQQDAFRWIRAAHSEGPQRFEWQARHKDGSLFWEDVFVQVIPLRGVERTIAIAVDISKRKRIEEQMRHMAQHDNLTGLPNRALFADRLRQGISFSKRAGVSLALLYIDLDLFKPINDNFGHAAGDAVLVEVATRLKKTIRTSDTVGRVGGDEFNVLLAVVADEGAARAVAEQIRDELQGPVVYEGTKLYISSSIGVALYPLHAQQEQDLIRTADKAMYKSKQSGRNKVMLADEPPIP